MRPATTAVYLTITSELFAEANRRFVALAAPAISEARRDDAELLTWLASL